MNIDLRLGDCLDIMPQLEAQSFDAIIADIPYGTTACKWDTVIPFAPMWENLKRLAKPRAAIVLFGSQPFTSALVMSNPQWFRYEWIWEKNNGSNFATTKYAPMKQHENILVFSIGGIAYNPIMQERTKSSYERLAYSLPPYRGVKREFVGGLSDNGKSRSYDRDKRVPSSVQLFDVCPHYAGTLHPTQKPVALLEYLVRTYTNEGDAVLDFTMGSGTCGVACVKTGRGFVGIEKEAEYFEIAKRRIAEAQAQMTTELVCDKSE